MSDDAKFQMAKAVVETAIQQMNEDLDREMAAFEALSASDKMDHQLRAWAYILAQESRGRKGRRRA